MGVILFSSDAIAPEWNRAPPAAASPKMVAAAIDCYFPVQRLSMAFVVMSALAFIGNCDERAVASQSRSPAVACHRAPLKPPGCRETK
jgi:hypothetical protein